MGRGDRTSKRGKVWRGTHGKTRPKEQKLRTLRRKRKKEG